MNTARWVRTPLISPILCAIEQTEKRYTDCDEESMQSLIEGRVHSLNCSAISAAYAECVHKGQEQAVAKAIAPAFVLSRPYIFLKPV